MAIQGTREIRVKQFKLVRMFIVCCAADARPLAVSIEISGSMTARGDGMGEGDRKAVTKGIF